MPERRTIDDRLSALERRLDDRAAGKAESQTDPQTAETNDESTTQQLEARVASLEAEIADLEAGLQAVRGYVGSVERVNESVEQRANAAIAAVERLESAPKTPPPIATATPGHTAGEGPDQQPEDGPPEANKWTDSPASEDGPAGVLERLRALR